MQSLVATRSELLERRRRAVFLAQGRDLQKDKKTAQVPEFRHHQTELLDGLEQLRALAVQARQRLDRTARGWTVRVSADGRLTYPGAC